MNTLEAIQLFGIHSVKNLSLDDIKKRYRQLIKEAHPDSKKNSLSDVGGVISNLGEARKLLETYVNIRNFNDNNSKRETFIISLDSLQKIYNRETIDVGESKLDISKIRYSEIYIEFSYTISINGVKKEEKKLLHHLSSDNYEIFVDIDVNEENIHKEFDIEIEMDGERLKVIIGDKSIIRTIKYKYNIDVKFNIKKMFNRVEEEKK